MLLDNQNLDKDLPGPKTCQTAFGHANKNINLSADSMSDNILLAVRRLSEKCSVGKVSISTVINSFSLSNQWLVMYLLFYCKQNRNFNIERRSYPEPLHQVFSINLVLLKAQFRETLKRCLVGLFS